MKKPFHIVATVLSTGLALFVLALSLVFLFDGMANKQSQYAAINYVFAALGVGFTWLILGLNRYYDRICHSLPLASNRDGRMLGWYLSVLYSVLIGLFLLGGIGVGARIMQGLHVFG